VILNTTGYDQPEALLRDADTAMYRAKAGGGTPWSIRYIHVWPGSDTLHLENDPTAVKNQEFQRYITNQLCH